MPVGVRGLADTRVPELLLDPPHVRACLEQHGGESMPRGVIRAVGELGLAEQRFPDLLEEEGIADEIAARRREDHLPLLSRPLRDGPAEIDRLEVTT